MSEESGSEVIPIGMETGPMELSLDEDIVNLTLGQ